MATLGRIGSVRPAAREEKKPPAKPLTRLEKAWEITKLLYKNDFTRYVSIPNNVHQSHTHFFAEELVETF